MTLTLTLAFAQTKDVTTVSVHVIVKDVSGAVVPNAEVRVASPTAPFADTQGRTTLTLSPGDYDLLALYPGFTSQRKSVKVVAGTDALVEFALRPAPVGSPIVIADIEKVPQDTPSNVGATVDATTLRVSLPDRPSQTLSVADLKALLKKTVTFHNVHTKADETYSGVPLTDLLAKYGAPSGDKLHGKALSEYIIATGSDGYKAVLALAETDPAFHPGDVIVADTLDGKPIGDKDGPFRFVVTEDKRPARCVHNLVSIELKTVD